MVGLFGQLRKRRADLKKIPRPSHLLGEFFVEATTGVYVVEGGGHCLTLDCQHDLLLDTEDCHRYPEHLSLQNMRAMGVAEEELRVAYQIVPLK